MEGWNRLDLYLKHAVNYPGDTLVLVGVLSKAGAAEIQPGINKLDMTVCQRVLENLLVLLDLMIIKERSSAI